MARREEPDRKSPVLRRDQFRESADDVTVPGVKVLRYGMNLKVKSNRVFGNLIDGNTGTVVASVAFVEAPTPGMYVVISRTTHSTSKMQIRIPPEQTEDRLDQQEAGIFRYNAILLTRRDIQFAGFLSLFSPVQADQWYDALPTDGRTNRFRMYLSNETMFGYLGKSKAKQQKAQN